MKVLLALAVGVFMIAAPVAVGEDRGGPSEDSWWCPHTWYIPESAPQESSPIYVAYNGILTDGWIAAVWVYAESNGEEGLQRYDPYCTNGSPDEADWYAANHDMIII